MIGVFPALGVGALIAESMSGGQMTPAVWSSFSLSVWLLRSCWEHGLSSAAWELSAAWAEAHAIKNAAAKIGRMIRRLSLIAL